MSELIPEMLVQEGPVVVVSGRACDFLFAAADLDEVRHRVRGRDRELDVTLEAMRRARALWRRAAVGPVSADPSAPAQVSEYVNAGEAARMLHVGQRHIGKLIQSGRLIGEKVDGRWQVVRASVIERSGK